MAKFLGFVVLLLAAAVAALWVAFYQPQQDALASAQAELTALKADAEACEARATGLEGRVEVLEEMRSELQRSSVELQEAIAAKEKELAEIRSTQDELVDELRQEIADNQVSVNRIHDQLRVDMVDEILFDSGETTIKAAGLEVLRKVGAVLKKAENRRIEIQGHTDNVPIRGSLAKRFPTNWELSAARAVNVARFLQDEAGVDPAHLSAAGYSEYRPRSENDSAEGRRQNRRIEILLVPLLPSEKPAAPAEAPSGEADQPDETSRG